MCVCCVGMVEPTFNQVLAWSEQEEEEAFQHFVPGPRTRNVWKSNNLEHFLSIPHNYSVSARSLRSLLAGLVFFGGIDWLCTICIVIVWVCVSVSQRPVSFGINANVPSSSGLIMWGSCGRERIDFKQVQAVPAMALLVYCEAKTLDNSELVCNCGCEQNDDDRLLATQVALDLSQIMQTHTITHTRVGWVCVCVYFAEFELKTYRINNALELVQHLKHGGYLTLGNLISLRKLA